MLLNDILVFLELKSAFICNYEKHCRKSHRRNFASYDPFLILEIKEMLVGRGWLMGEGVENKKGKRDKCSILICACVGWGTLKKKQNGHGEIQVFFMCCPYENTAVTSRLLQTIGHLDYLWKVGLSVFSGRCEHEQFQYYVHWSLTHWQYWSLEYLCFLDYETVGDFFLFETQIPTLSL